MESIRWVEMGSRLAGFKGTERRSSCPDLLPGPGIQAQMGQVPALPLKPSERGHVTSVSWCHVCWGQSLQVGIPGPEIPWSRGSQTAILLALRPHSHSAQHPCPMPWGQPMKFPPTTTTTRARLRGKGPHPGVELPGEEVLRSTWGPAGPSLLCPRGTANRTTSCSGIWLKTQAVIF